MRRVRKDKERTDLQTARYENRRLKAEVKRLRREVEKRLVESAEAHPQDDEPAMSEAPPVPKDAIPTGCPGCGGSDYSRVKTGYKTIVACRSCNHRHTE